MPDACHFVSQMIFHLLPLRKTSERKKEGRILNSFQWWTKGKGERKKRREIGMNECFNWPTNKSWNIHSIYSTEWMMKNARKRGQDFLEEQASPGRSLLFDTEWFRFSKIAESGGMFEEKRCDDYYYPHHNKWYLHSLLVLMVQVQFRRRRFTDRDVTRDVKIGNLKEGRSYWNISFSLFIWGPKYQQERREEILKSKNYYFDQRWIYLNSSNHALGNLSFDRRIMNVESYDNIQRFPLTHIFQILYVENSEWKWARNGGEDWKFK